MLKYGLSNNALDENPLYRPEEWTGDISVSLSPKSVLGFLLFGYAALCYKAFFEGISSSPLHVFPYHQPTLILRLGSST